MRGAASRQLTVAAALLLFAAVLGLIVRGAPNGLDLSLSHALALRRGTSPSWLVDAMWWVSWLTSSWRKFALAALAGLLLGGVRWRAILPALSVALGGTIAEVAKPLFGRVRPALDQLDPIASAAYPSGHSANAAALMVGILCVAPSRWRGPLLSAAIFVAGLTGLSRVMLAVHWPTDVLGGWAIGVASALILYVMTSTILEGRLTDAANDDRRGGGAGRATDGAGG